MAGGSGWEERSGSIKKQAFNARENKNAPNGALLYFAEREGLAGLIPEARSSNATKPAFRELNLQPTHADRAGGLGIILLAQRSFNLLFAVISVLISGALVTQLMENPDSFNTVRGEMIGYIVFCLVLLLCPLLFFTGKLVRIKNEGLVHLSNLGATLSRKFEAEWINDLPIEKIISNKQADPSMVYDYAGVYDAVQQLRIIPVTLRDVISMALILFVPFIPILLIHFSVADLLQKILGLLV